MKYKIHNLSTFLRLIAITVLILISAAVSQASTTRDFVLHEATDATFYNYTFNNFVLDVTLPGSQGGEEDILKAVTIQQMASAQTEFDFRNIILWADALDPGFQGYALDKALGVMSYNNVCDCFYLDNLSEAIPASGVRLFVSLEVPGAARDGKRIQFSLMQLNDKDKDGVFDLGESGVFTASKNNGPTDEALVNPVSHRVTNRTNDGLAPLAVITNLQDGGVIHGKSFLIQGKAKDQGKSSPMNVEIIIDGKVFPATATSDSYGTWEYMWQEMMDGKHTLQVQGSDFYGNSGVASRSVHITVDGEDSIDIAKSQVLLNPNPMDLCTAANGELQVILSDEEGDPYSGAKVYIEQMSGISVYYFNDEGDDIASSLETDARGTARFLFRAADIGSAEIRILATDLIGRISELGTYVIEFVETIETELEDEDPQEAEDEEESKVNWTLEKLLTSSTVYLVADNTMYATTSGEVFEAWGLSDDDIKVVSSFPSDQERGGMLKFPDGTLIKGTEAAVSIVTDNGKRAWIKDEQTFIGLGYKWSDIHVITDAELALYERIADIDDTSQHPNGTLIKYEHATKVYLLQAGEKRWIETETAFLANYFQFERVITVQDSEQYIDGESIISDERFLGFMNER